MSLHNIYFTRFIISEMFVIDIWKCNDGSENLIIMLKIYNFAIYSVFIYVNITQTYVFS